MRTSLVSPKSQSEIMSNVYRLLCPVKYRKLCFSEQKFKKKTVSRDFRPDIKLQDCRRQLVSHSWKTNKCILCSSRFCAERYMWEDYTVTVRVLGQMT